MNGSRALGHTKVTPTQWGAIARSVLVVVTMALLGAMLVTMAEAAPRPLSLLLQMDTTVPIEDRVAGWQQMCTYFGGTPETHYELDVNFDIITAYVYCHGGEDDGSVCEAWPTEAHCGRVGSFVQPTQPVVPEQRPDTAAPAEEPAQTVPIVDDIAVPPGGAAEDPTGEDQETIASQTVNDQVGACETFGGTATVTDNRLAGTIDVRCSGGVFDGMVCRNGHYDSVCTSYRSPADPEQDPSVPPTGGIADGSVPDTAEPEGIDDVTAQPGGAEDPTGPTTSEITFVRVASMADLEDALLAEDPTGTDTVVIANQSGSPVDLAAVQAAMCRLAGGKAQNLTFEKSYGQETKVRCYGGLADGMLCVNNTVDPSFCWYRAAVPADPEVTPAAGIEAPAGAIPETPTIAPTPTEVSVTPTALPPTPSPTVVPTIELVEATAVPTQALPDPKNDNAVPPGDEAEDPTENEPAPTEAPLR